MTRTYTRLVLQLIPLSDRNPTSRTPYVTLALIAINVFVFIFVQPDFGSSTDADLYFFDKAAIPCQLEQECPAGYPPPNGPVDIPERDITSFLAALIFSTFLHAGWLHIGGNMLFLWVFGNNIEDFLGSLKYLFFYLASGIAAGFAHILTDLGSAVPAVGASGAVAGVMGAYIVLHPKARVRVLVPVFFFLTFMEWPAFIVLGFWFVTQFLIGVQQVGGGGVAWMAHVGGFVFGVIAIYILGGRPQRPQAAWSQYWRYQQR